MAFKDGSAQVIKLPSTALTHLTLPIWLALIMSAFVHCC
jgi:hypothetical protein